ncbi:MAG: Uncharacterized protein aq_1682, partial [uncultured Pseudonocardia sp.]
DRAAAARRAGRRHRGLHAPAVLRGAGPRAVPAARRRRRHLADRARLRPGGHLRRGHRGARAARGRHLRLRRLPHRRRRAARAGAGGRGGDDHPRRAGVLRAPDPGRRGAAGHRHRAGAGAVVRQDGHDGAGRARPRRRADPGQPGVPRRHARRPRLHLRHLRGRHQDELRAVPAVLDLPLRRAGAARCQHEGAGVQRQGRGPAVPRPAQHPARRQAAREVRQARAARGAVLLRRVLRPADPRRPERAPARHRAHLRRHPVLVDARRVLPRGAAALRLRRRRGRAQPVHDGDPPGRGPAQAGGRGVGRRLGDDGRAHAAHLRRPHRVRVRPAHRRGRPARLGGTGHGHRHDQRVPAPAAVERQAPAHADPRRPGRGQGAPGQHRGPAAHGRRPAQPPGAGAAVRRRRGAGGRDRAQGGRGGGRAALHHDRRAEQVRPAGGFQPDQGGAARHRRARPEPRHHPHRRAADGLGGGAADRLQLLDQGRRPARPRRGGPPGVRLPAAVAARPRGDREAGHDVRRAAGDPGAAGRRVPVPGLGDAAVGGGSRAGRPQRARAAGPVRAAARRAGGRRRAVL